MAAVIKMVCKETSRPLPTVADRLCRKLGDVGLVHQANALGDRAILLCFERYYFRNGSTAALTILLTEETDGQSAELVGFGGGSGLLNISWGANSSFVESAADALYECGFEEV